MIFAGYFFLPSPLVGEGRGGGVERQCAGALTQVNDLATPTPSPSPQGGGESMKGEYRARAPQVSRDASLTARRSMDIGATIAIGLFGPNCSSGRAVMLVPERWSGNWQDNKRLANHVVTRRESISCCRSAAGRAAAATPTIRETLRSSTITWATGPRLPPRHHRIWHRACPDLQSRGGGEGNGHRRPVLARLTLRASTSSSAGTKGRARHGLAPSSARTRTAGAECPGVDRRHQVRSSQTRRTSTSTGHVFRT